MSRSSGRDFEDAERAMYQVQHRLEGNMHCADCGTTRPEYANLTLGTFICKDCADVHRNISNRRIKDILGRDLTMDDVRRMEDVGNDKANRKFLATWDPREFPEPKPGDKEALKNFIWLKYDGAWKKVAPPSQQRHNSGRHDRYYGNGADDRGRAYGRERDLFRDPAPPPPSHPPPPPEPQRSFWADRVGQTAHRPHPQDDFRRSYSSGNPDHDRFRRAPSQERHDRFRPPTTGYSRGSSGGSRYEEPYEEEYERHEGSSRDGRGESRRREVLGSEHRVKERSRRKKSQANRYASEEENYYSEDGIEEKRKGSRRRGDASERKIKSSKSRRKKSVSEDEDESETYGDASGRKIKSSKSRRKKSVSEDEDESETYSEDSESEEDYASRSKKMSRKKKTAKKTSEKREGRKGSSKKHAEMSSEESEDDEEESPPQSPNQKGSRKSKSKSSTTVSVVTNAFEDGVDANDTANGNEVTIIKPPGQAKAEFDLMSDWMGGETDTTTVQSSSSAQTPVPQQPAAQHQQPGMQVPMMAPPVSMYGGMVPPGAAAAYMTGIPMMTPQGFMPMNAMPGMAGMPGIGMPGMYGMPQMPQMPGVGTIPSMTGMPGVPVMPQMGANGLVSSLQNMSLQPGVQQPVPPPPPPASVSSPHPVGPPPGPPPS